MLVARNFILQALRTDALPDTFTVDQVIDLVGRALQASADKRSDLDEERIAGLLAALKQIENTTTDVVAGVAARRARINSEDQ